MMTDKQISFQFYHSLKPINNKVFNLLMHKVFNCYMTKDDFIIKIQNKFLEKGAKKRLF